MHAATAATVSKQQPVCAHETVAPLPSPHSPAHASPHLSWQSQQRHHTSLIVARTPRAKGDGESGSSSRSQLPGACTSCSCSGCCSKPPPPSPNDTKPHNLHTSPHGLQWGWRRGGRAGSGAAQPAAGRRSSQWREQQQSCQCSAIAGGVWLRLACGRPPQSTHATGAAAASAEPAAAVCRPPERQCALCRDCRLSDPLPGGPVAAGVRGAALHAGHAGGRAGQRCQHVNAAAKNSSRCGSSFRCRGQRQQARTKFFKSRRPSGSHGHVCRCRHRRCRWGNLHP